MQTGKQTALIARAVLAMLGPAQAPPTKPSPNLSGCNGGDYVCGVRFCGDPADTV